MPPHVEAGLQALSRDSLRLGQRVGCRLHPLNRPEEIPGGGPGRPDLGSPRRQASLEGRQSNSVAGRGPDPRRAADHHCPDGARHFGRRPAGDVHLLVGQSGLIEKADTIPNPLHRGHQPRNSLSAAVNSSGRCTCTLWVASTLMKPAPGVPPLAVVRAQSLRRT